MQGLVQQMQIIADAFGSDTPAADRRIAWQRIAKTATTYGFQTAMQTALVKMLLDDREAYDLLADELKGQNLIIPAKWLKAPIVAAGVFSEADAERQFICIPMEQGVPDNTLYAGFLDCMSNLRRPSVSPTSPAGYWATLCLLTLQVSPRAPPKGSVPCFRVRSSLYRSLWSPTATGTEARLSAKV